jgi:hypothetical protein
VGLMRFVLVVGIKRSCVLHPKLLMPFSQDGVFGFFGFATKIEDEGKLLFWKVQDFYWIEIKILIHMYLTDTHINC